jgi:hypothetical protein
MKDQERSWEEYSAGWAKYLGWAVVRWIVIILFWAKEFIVVMVLFSAVLLGGALRHIH